DILILEAETRIGGRINSIYFGDAFIDLGAEWCVGQEDNAVYNLVKDYNLLQSTETDFRTFYFCGDRNMFVEGNYCWYRTCRHCCGDKTIKK
ncbi:Flavin containing amine oxidoreductase, partial [Popillia japonica]